MTIEDKLGVDKFHTDEINSHIEVDKESTDMEEIQKVIKACPAGLYKLDDENHLLFDHLGCLECGTCRILCGDTIIEKWEFPQAGMGVSYRFG